MKTLQRIAENNQLAPSLMAFLDTAATATGRATHYNTLEEQEAAVNQAHTNLLAIDRGLYTLALALPGLTDFSVIRGVQSLLKRQGQSQFMAPNIETQVIEWLVGTLPPQRMLKLFLSLKASRVSNQRTRKLILRHVLGSPKLEWWAVSYRRKMRSALRHTWGNSLYYAIRKILAKPSEARTEREGRILHRGILKYGSDRHKQEDMLEVVGFILGVEDRLTLPNLLAYHDAKKDLKAGVRLPYVTLEGIRSTYHPDIDAAESLKLTKAKLTKSQRLTFQRKSRAEGTEVSFNPQDYDPVQLYIYAFEMGMTAEIKRALTEKAERFVAQHRIQLGRVGLVLDTSMSMLGHETQKMRPFATALALRDVLRAGAEACICNVDEELPSPAGHTALARDLLLVMSQAPDKVFIITDGYENAPAGRVNEVLLRLKEMGFSKPVYQITPVLAAESGGVRSLSPETAVMPVANPKALSLGLLRLFIEREPRLAIEHMCRELSLKLSIPLNTLLGGES